MTKWEDNPSMALDAAAAEAKPEAPTVLVVDDQEIVCEFMLAAMQQCGYKTLSTYSGEEGLVLFAAHPREIDLVISDIVMPDISGYKMVERIRSIRPGIPVLFVTGTMQDHPVWAKTTCHVLQKPFTAAEFMTAVDACLRARCQ